MYLGFPSNFQLLFLLLLKILNIFNKHTETKEKILKKLRIHPIKYAELRRHCNLQCGLCKCVHKVKVDNYN